MAFYEGDESDAAAFVYIRSCLMGRAHRFRKKRSAQRQREPAILNEPLRQTEDSSDRLSMVVDSDPGGDPNHVINSVALQDAMQCLTPNESRIIKSVYFEGDKVVDLCESLDVSKNTVLKTKRNALKKLRAVLQKSRQTDQEAIS